MYCKKVKGRDSTAVQASGSISLGRPRQKNKSSFQAIAPGKSDLVPCGTWISTVLVATTYCQKVGNGNPKPRIARKWKAGAPLQSRYLKAFLLAGPRTTNRSFRQSPRERRWTKWRKHPSQYLFLFMAHEKMIFLLCLKIWEGYHVCQVEGSLPLFSSICRDPLCVSVRENSGEHEENVWLFVLCSWFCCAQYHHVMCVFFEHHVMCKKLASDLGKSGYAETEKL